ncbi:hypothetical protein [Metamycoplasma hominis]|uniref:hypothetical protein n=1 Tax=Metamycoplasma hominis TaxID=2098 RepID=UPI001E579689|nr:hypothetical protein [Metamycoplasma hominis]
MILIPKSLNNSFWKATRRLWISEINSSIKTLKTKLSDFYDKYIYPKLEKYELLK